MAELEPVDERAAAARELLRQAPLIDGHNDLAWVMRTRFGYDLDRLDIGSVGAETHTDIPRLRRGGVGAQFWSVYVPSSWDAGRAVAGTLEQIDFVHRMAARFPEELALAATADDIQRDFEEGRIACLLGAEGGQSIASSMGVLRTLFRLGVRYMTLTHNDNVPWADSATDKPAVGGLSDFGRAVVAEMQRLGMLADLSHVAPATMQAALDVSRAPVIFSHSSARALCDHPRNVPDAILTQLAANGGVCMVTFVPQFVSPACRDWGLELRAQMEVRGLSPDEPEDRERISRLWIDQHPAPPATLAQVADHVEHVREVAGIDHVGLGGDFDGTDQTPVGLEDVSCYPQLISELQGRHWSDQECLALAGGNLLRALRHAEEASRQLSSREGPSLLQWKVEPGP